MRPIINYSEELRPLGEMKLIYPKLRATIDHLRVHIVFITLSLTKQLPFGIAKLQRTGNDLSLGEIWGIIRSYPDVFSCTQCTHGNKKKHSRSYGFQSNRTAMLSEMPGSEAWAKLSNHIRRSPPHGVQEKTFRNVSKLKNNVPMFPKCQNHFLV